MWQDIQQLQTCSVHCLMTNSVKVASLFFNGAVCQLENNDCVTFVLMVLFRNQRLLFWSEEFVQGTIPKFSTNLKPYVSLHKNLCLNLTSPKCQTEHFRIYVTHHNNRYLMSARLILRYWAKQLVKYNENNKKNTPPFCYFFRSFL